MPQQLSQFTPQVNQALTDLDIVFRILVDTLRILRHIQLATQFALRAVSHERRVTGEVERKHPALLLLLLRSQGSSLTSRVGQTVELSLICDMQRKGLVLLQQILRELQTEHRSLLRQLAQSLLTSGIQQRTTAHKTIVAVVEQHLLLRRQLPMMPMHILDPLKQFLVQADVVRMLRQDRTHLLRQRIHFVVGLGREQIEEHRRGTSQQIIVMIAVLLVIHIDDGIVESRFIRIIDDLLYLFIITTDTLQHRLLVIL